MIIERLLHLNDVSQDLHFLHPHTSVCAKANKTLITQLPLNETSVAGGYLKERDYAFRFHDL